MSHTSAAHRSLDRRYAEALARDGGDLAHGHALVMSRNRLKDARTMTTPRKPRVLLVEVEIRTSERTGKAWYSAWLGKARLIGFEAEEANARGHRVIQFYAEEPEPREGAPAPLRRAQGREATDAGSTAPLASTARPGGSYRASQRESDAACRERVSAEIARGPGVHSDNDLNDVIGF